MQRENKDHFPRILGVLERIETSARQVDYCYSLICKLAGGLARSRRDAPALPQASEFKSERKLDLPLAIRQLSGDLARSRSDGFRERGYVTSITVEHGGAQVIAAKISMVQDVEEFRAELQHAGFSQKP